MTFGSNAGVDDIGGMMRSEQAVRQFGLAAISAGNVVSAYLANEGEFGNSASRTGA